MALKELIDKYGPTRIMPLTDEQLSQFMSDAVYLGIHSEWYHDTVEYYKTNPNPKGRLDVVKYIHKGILPD